MSHADAGAHLAAKQTFLGERFLREDPNAVDAFAWIRAHQPTEHPAVLLHGDLLPQNILIGLVSQRSGVVDWEYARVGDPAYDLAIVTRGNRKLLGIDRGLHRLLVAYREAEGAPIEPEDVVVWELLLVLRWLYKAQQDERYGQSPEFYRNQLRAILRRTQR